MSVSVLPSSYCHQSHPLHGSGRIWDETNCYLDVVIELLHAFGHEPLAALGVTASTCWEGDQWTFCKFNDEDLRFLFGIDIQELNPWQSLELHLLEQLKRGNAVLIEADAFFLPDTRGVSYRLAHDKTTIGVLEMAPEARRMRYLHGRGCFELEAEDYAGLWQTGSEPARTWLPPFVERVARSTPSRTEPLAMASATLLRRELKRAPVANPIEAFSASLEAGLPVMRDNHDMDHFHRFAFATLRQLGACFELLTSHVTWLQDHCAWKHTDANQHFLLVAQLGRSLQFQLARSIARNKILDLSPLVQMGKAWQCGIDALHSGAD